MKTLFTLLLLIISNLLFAQLDFVKQIGGGNDNTFYCVETDANGNIIVAGRFAGTSDFNPGSGTEILTSSTGSFDLFLAKYSPIGDLLWVHHTGEVYEDAIKSITIDVSGNIYATGQFSGTVDFDFGTGLNLLTTFTTNKPEQFIMKVDPNGTVLMVKQIGLSSNGEAYGTGIDLDGAGNIFTTGYFIGTVDFDPHATNTFPLSANGGNFDSDIFVSKYDVNGDFVWAVRAGGNSFTPDIGRAITVDTDENVYITGDFASTADFNPGAGTTNLISNGNADSFLWKLTNDGNLIRAVNYGSVANDFVTSIDVDINAYIYLSGYFIMACDFDPTGGTNSLNAGNSFYDGYVFKMDSTFALGWVKSIDGSTANIMCHDVISDASGDVFATGRLQGTADFDPSGSTFTQMSSNINEFTWKLNSNGDFVCATQTGNSGSSEGLSIALDANSHIITSGGFAGVVDFNPSTSIDNFTATSNPGSDGYIKKLFCPIDVNSINENETEIFSIYPNPANNFLQLNYSGENNYSYQIINSIGETILSEKAVSKNKSIDLRDYADGIYFIRIMQSENTQTLKFVISN